MKLVVVNPNTTVSVTEKIGEAARAVAAPATEIVVVNPDAGLPSIEGYYDQALSVTGVLDQILRGERNGCDGYVIACFDDPGLNAARALANAPVLGICEASMHVAALVATSFSVVTTLPRSVPIIEELALRYGMARRCRRVRAAGVPVLALEDPGSEARDRVVAEAQRAVTEDRAEALILGCAGMTDLAAWLETEIGVPVIDGVVAAVKLVESLVNLGIKTSKTGAYAAPLAKDYAGEVGRFNPIRT